MENLGTRYLQLLRDFRRTDLVSFYERHDRLFKEARRTGDHAEVTKSYYTVMSPLIETYYGTSLHFCPPEHPEQTRDEATRSMHHRVARLLQHGVGKKALDIGCGIGGMMRDVALYSGGEVVGITIGENEVRESNELNRRAGLEHLCKTIQGDYHDMPFEEHSFDSAYAVYSLKYFPKLQPIFAEIFRVLKPGGLFLIYDIVKTAKYDSDNPEHARLVEGFEYACGMPALHTNVDMMKEAGAVGFQFASQMDISQGQPWYHYFKSPLLMWLMRSNVTRAVLGGLEASRVLPRGFKQFNEVFVAGTVRALVEAGEMGILSGSNILIFKKPPQQLH